MSRRRVVSRAAAGDSDEGGCPNYGPTCEGDGCRRCGPGSTQKPAFEDCALQSGACERSEIYPSGWQCVGDDVTEPCIEETFGRQCSGPFLVTCDVGVVANVDCRTLGFASCVDPGGGGALCK